LFRAEAPQRNTPLSLVLRLTLLLALIPVLLAMGGAGYAYSAYADLSDSLKTRLDSIDQQSSFETTRIYDRNGVLLYELLGAGKRTKVPLDQIDDQVKNATIAIEDKTFFDNEGVDYLGILRTLYASLSAGEVTGGGSTITQQLIKLTFLTEEERQETWQRKIKEIALAEELSQRLPKEEILELYLNEIYYGNLAYGIEAAANTYFSASSSDLNLAQSALLAGLPQLPNVYDPFNFLEGGVLPGIPVRDGWLAESYQLPSGTPPPKWRQIAVLRQMVDEQYVTEAEARAAAEQDLRFKPLEVPLRAPHFVFYVQKLLEEQYGDQFANLGLNVYTTLDLELHETTQRLAAERIAELEERNIHNSAVVVMQPNTGQILAMVGSIDYNKVKKSPTPGEKGNVIDGQVNVTVRERQPGSALKPFTYLAAMEKGMTPETVLWDVPTKFGAPGTRDIYAPLNYNGKWNGPVRMRTALANSLNMPAVKALKFAGVPETIDLLRRAGITGLQRDANFYGLSLTLGGGEVTPLDLTAAYNTLASNGRYYPPTAILRVVDGNGKEIQQPRPVGQQVLNPYHVAIMTDMMSDDEARKPVWGLNSKLQLSRPAAVKTGTTNDWRDAWAVGYTPYVTVGVWTGNNNNETTAKVESLTGGGTIWHNVMEAIFADERLNKLLSEPYGTTLPLDFVRPTQLVKSSICELGGPYNQYKEELFTPDMLDPVQSATATRTPQTARANRNRCDAYTTVRVVKITTTSIAEDGSSSEQVAYCRPIEGETVPESALTMQRVWKLPPPDPNEQVVYQWTGNGIGASGNFPFCTTEQIMALNQPVDVPTEETGDETSPIGIRMPDLRRLGENQAKEMLAALGITNPIVVDYQGRDRIPDIFDKYPPYAVVSTSPAPGTLIRPGQTIILGIRAPDSAPAPDPGQPPPATP
jgi:peptidoglycan glycosyltransferase